MARKIDTAIPTGEHKELYVEDTDSAPALSARATGFAVGWRLGAFLLLLSAVAQLLPGALHCLVFLLTAASRVAAGVLAAGALPGARSPRRLRAAAIAGLVAGTVSSLPQVAVGLVPELNVAHYRNWLLLNHTVGNSPHVVAGPIPLLICLGWLAVPLGATFLLAVLGYIAVAGRDEPLPLAIRLARPLAPGRGLLLAISALALYLALLSYLAPMLPDHRALLAETYYYRGIAFYNRGDGSRAIAQYDRSLELAPDNAKAFVNRGVVYRELGQLDRARADLDAGLRLNPQDALGYSNRAWVSWQEGDLEGAQADFERALHHSDDPAFQQDLRAALSELEKQ